MPPGAVNGPGATADRPAPVTGTLVGTGETGAPVSPPDAAQPPIAISARTPTASTIHNGFLDRAGAGASTSIEAEPAGATDTSWSRGDPNLGLPPAEDAAAAAGARSGGSTIDTTDSWLTPASAMARSVPSATVALDGANDPFDADISARVSDASLVPFTPAMSADEGPVKPLNVVSSSSQEGRIALASCSRYSRVGSFETPWSPALEFKGSAG